MSWRRREFEGEIWEWGQVRGARRPGWAPWRGRGYSPGVRRGRAPRPRRGEWQWRGHGPSSGEGYGWEYRGGAPRSEHDTWPESIPGRGMGGGRLMEEIRSGGLPRDRERYQAESGWTPGAAPPGPRGRPMPRRDTSELHDYDEPYRGRHRERRFRPAPRRYSAARTRRRMREGRG